MSKAPYYQAHAPWRPFNEKAGLSNVLPEFTVIQGTKMHRVYIDGIEAVQALYRNGIADPYVVCQLVRIATTNADHALIRILEQ